MLFTEITEEQLCAFGLAVLEIEAQAINKLKHRIGSSFAAACRHLLGCQGRIIVTGMGKSGHVGRKIAATFASTGSPAFFIHAAEANHGDLGMITEQDVVLAISNSGETLEVNNILPLLKRLNVPVICLSGNSDSTLAKAATVYLDASVAEEACPLGLAPTSSTTATLALGDALAIALLRARGFTAQDFARYHPGGQLGRRLLLRVQDIMRTGNAIPKVCESDTVDHALLEMTQKSLGMTTVLDKHGRLKGVYTDGDLRRTLNRKLDITQTKLSTVMTAHYKSIGIDRLAAEALNIMETCKITTLTVVDKQSQVIGIVHMHDLLTAGLA